MRMTPRRRILPKRRSNNGTRPGITGEDPMSKERGCQDQWEFPKLGNGLSNEENRLLMAKVLKTAVVAMFRCHIYIFAQKFYHQQEGGPIGLRRTCCIARLTMLWWDDKLLFKFYFISNELPFYFPMLVVLLLTHLLALVALLGRQACLSS